MSHIDVPHGRDEHQGSSLGLALTLFICSVPMLLMVLVLYGTGGGQAGFLIPAVIGGGMIGMLMYTSFRDQSNSR